MITKGIIKEILTPYEVKVQIPLLNSTLDSVICTIPNSKFLPEVDDIVFVGFEDYDLGKPVILGCLFKENGNISGINIDCISLNVNGRTQLNSDIKIGDLTYEELKSLIGCKQNINIAIQNIEDRLDKLEGN